MKLQVLHDKYQNTGGNCMVDVFTMYDHETNRTLYLMVNEEGGTLSTADYISWDVEFDETMIVGGFDIDHLKPTDDNFKLYRDCWLIFVRNDCRGSNLTYKVHLDIMPDSMKQSIPNEYLSWHILELGYEFDTDGYKILLDELYDGTLPENEDVLAAKHMLRYMDDQLELSNDDDKLQQFYDLPVSIQFGERTFSVGNCAAIYNGIQEALKFFIDNV